MKKSILLILEICATLPVIGQATIDTLYYDKNWKREENKIFALAINPGTLECYLSRFVIGCPFAVEHGA